MREKGGNATLGELIGGASEMSLTNLPEILGEKMPELPKTKVGRYRLVRALRHRFGDNYRNIPGVKGLIAEFDDDLRHEGVRKKLSGIKPIKKEK